MKKTLFIILMFLSILSVSAQGFKSFVDIYGGISTIKGIDGGKVRDEYISDIHPLVAFGLNVTEGYQINRMIFAGIGFGGYTVLDHFKEDYTEYWYRDTLFPAILLPVFADVRWTLDIERRITPFVDLKIGYQFCCDLSDGIITWNSYDSENLYIHAERGFYFQPTIGCRFGGNSAFNLGLTYNPTIRQKLYFSPKGREVLNLMKNINGGALMLSFGADF